MQDLGSAADFDAQKVIGSLAVDGTILVPSFLTLLEEAKVEARRTSKAVQKFHNIIRDRGQALSEEFLSKDLNLDGQLNLDGFKSSVIGTSDLA